MPAENPRKNLECFVQLVLADPNLLEQLRAPVNLEHFAALAIRLGRDRGCDFTAEEVRAAVRERRRAWLERGF